ncbi:MAG TPA: M28 family metallopeptidase [Candidatus Eisenbacteria bacterium]|nr:M28 family metallopeptidase [Candidatus Eisenbacteria bacterium]
MTSRAVPITIIVAGFVLLGSLLLLSSCGPEIPAESQWMSHVRALADDHTRGRESALEGYREASDYVARELRRYGVEPMGDSGTYFQRVPFVARTIDESKCDLALVQGRRVVPLTLGEDAAHSMKLDPAASLNARLVFVGYGLQIPEEGYDDLAGLDLKGAVAVILGGAPKGVKGPLLAHYSSRIERWKALRRAGAIGAIQVPVPAFSEVKWNLTAPSRLTPSLVLEGSQFDESPGARIFLYWNAEKAPRLFQGSKYRYTDLTKLAERGERLPRFELPYRLRAHTASTVKKTECRNVVGMIRGSDKKLREQYVVLSGHLDHLGVGEPVDGDSIYNGALDNASGCATLLEIARMLKRSGHGPKRSILFLFTTAEESGLLGATYFASRPTVPGRKMIANLNINMFLPIQPIRGVTAYGIDESDLGDVFRRVAKLESLKVVPDPHPQRRYFIRSDQYPFIRKGIPALMLDSGPTDSAAEAADQAWKRDHYHQPSDDAAQTIDLGAVARFDRFALALTRAVADGPKKPQWKRESLFRRYAGGGGRSR